MGGHQAVQALRKENMLVLPEIDPRFLGQKDHSNVNILLIELGSVLLIVVINANVSSS
jgi:hypothetical protein